MLQKHTTLGYLLQEVGRLYAINTELLFWCFAID